MRDAFALESTLIYLNAANLSLCPRVVLESLSRYTQEFERNPTEGLARAWGYLWTVQTELARFFEGDPNDFLLRSNVTSILNTFLLGIPLEEGAEILVSEHEYGAILNICRLRARRENLKLRILRLPASPLQFERLTRQSLLNHVVSQIGPDTKILLLSHVMSGTGLVMPIEEIAMETRKRGVSLVVDGAYACGAMPVSFTELHHVDFYGCSLYKWMLGPKGTAFGWVSKSSQSLLLPVQAGWTTLGDESPVRGFSTENSFAKAFLMSGCHDFAPFRAIHDTLLFWERLGPTSIRARAQELSDFLSSQVERHLNWVPLRANDASLRSAMRIYQLPNRLQGTGAAITRNILEQFGIQINSACLNSKWYVIFSPYIHNSEEEIETAVKRLQAL